MVTWTQMYMPMGGLGLSALVAGQVTGIDPFHIGAMAGRQLPFLSVLVPFWLVAMMDGWKGGKETWPAALVAGGSFAVTQFFTSNYIGPELPDITSALVSIVSLALFLKVWRPKNTETAISMGQSAGAMVVNKPSSGGPVPSEYSLGQIIRAWSPFLILTVLVTIWTMKPFKALFAPGGAFYSLVINFQIPHLHQQVLKAAPIVANQRQWMRCLNSTLSRLAAPLFLLRRLSLSSSSAWASRKGLASLPKR